MANYHVMKDNDLDQWVIKKEGSERASTYVDYQREAEKLAKQFAANSGGGEVRIHGLDGKIRDSDTIPSAHDPYPPRDEVH